MKKQFFILILLVVLVAVFRVPGLQAEDWVGNRTANPLICSLGEGQPDFPILCPEGVNAKQLDDVRGMYAAGIASAFIEVPEGENRIILWDEPNGASTLQISSSTVNNQSYSSFTAVRYK